MRIAICDDEKEIRDSIERCVRIAYKDVDIIQFSNGKSVLEYPEQIDILFLDIQMEELDGMETARALRKAGNNAIIIFVTGNEEYVFQAFDVGAFHYLLKPIDQVKFFEVFKKAIEERQAFQVKSIKEEPSIAVKQGTSTQRIFLCEILYVEVFNRKIIIHKIDKDIEFYGKLSDLENSLGDDFIRCHRSYMINFRYVLRYDAASITLEKRNLLIESHKAHISLQKRDYQNLKTM